MRVVDAMSCRLLAALLIVWPAAGCRIGGDVEPIALRGPAPRTVLVWPAVAPEFAAQEPTLLTGLDQAVVRRGYQVTSAAVARQLLAERGLAGPEPQMDRIRDELGVDAVLLLVVREFTTAGERLQSASWDLAWELHATRGGVIWEFTHTGNWNRSMVIEEDPLRPIDAEPNLVPPARQVAPNFHDDADLAAWLHRFAMERLPQAGR